MFSCVIPPSACLVNAAFELVQNVHVMKPSCSNIAHPVLQLFISSEVQYKIFLLDCQRWVVVYSGSLLCCPSYSHFLLFHIITTPVLPWQNWSSDGPVPQQLLAMHSEVSVSSGLLSVCKNRDTETALFWA